MGMIWHIIRMIHNYRCMIYLGHASPFEVHLSKLPGQTQIYVHRYLGVEVADSAQKAPDDASSFLLG